MEVEEFEHPTLQIVQEAQVKKLEGMITIIFMITILLSTSSAGHSLAILTQPHTPISKVKCFA